MDINSKIEAARVGGGAALVTIWGITLNELVAGITAVYLVLQIILVALKIFQVVSASRKKMSIVE